MKSCLGKLALIVCACFGAGNLPGVVSAAGLQTLSLDGTWEFAPEAGSDWLPASVPGCVHTDLLAARKIPDPFYRENEKAVQWIGETNWIYRRVFQVSSNDLAHDRVLLRCEGLDTFAIIRLNGHELGHTDNMFRTWEFDAKPVLRIGTNNIEVRFDSVLPYMRKRNTERPLYEWSGPHEPTGRAWVRKAPCDFGWDWGPVLITCGIWRPIELVMFDEARLADVAVLQDLSEKSKAKLTVQIAAETVHSPNLRAIVHVAQANQHIAQSEVELVDGKATARLAICDPQLWWPNGMGEHPLYEVQVDLYGANHALLDRSVKRIGLRTIQLLPADQTHSLRFAVNGIPFFAKGANWIPADPFPNRVTTEKRRRYVADAVAANMNMLRFWGGGYYEENALYDACDEMGILVWADCKFACSSYPAFDPAFMANVRQEIRDNVRRLRHHPSLAVWCGNNEISLMTGPQWSTNSMARADYDELFSDLIGGEIKQLDPQALYVAGSPEVGDVHYWQVWHGGKPFEAYHSLNGFLSEFGFQSFPEPGTVNAYTAPEDRASLFTPVMKWHQRSAGDGNKMISDMMNRYFRPAKDFESALWLSQILQGYGIKTGAEFWRQNMPLSMGCIFWQYNDIWPVASWSSVDYFGRWKALQYLARRFYAPVLISGRVDATNQSVAVYATSDLLTNTPSHLLWELTDLHGKTLAKDDQTLELAAQTSQMVTNLNLAPLVKTHGASNLLVWLKLETAGHAVSDNLVTLVYPKELNLPEPHLKTSIRQEKGNFYVSLTADAPALWAWLAVMGIDARYSDNFIHVKPGTVAEICVTPQQSLSLEQFRKALIVRSLTDVTD
jgi:beta-mannosidase